MKYEWKKLAKEFYLPKNKPETINVPEFKLFMLDGKQNPNDKEFSESIGVLYSLSYAIKMMSQNGITPDGYFNYSAFPLEGVWDIAEEARKTGKIDKNSLIYSIMIRQPDFVTSELANGVIEIVKKRNRIFLQIASNLVA